MIDVKNLEKSFEGHQVLKGINEHIYKGEKVAIIGPPARASPPSCAA